MSDMKCPVCGKQMKIGTLDQDDSMGTVWMSIMPCDCVCSYGASKAVWQELIRTKKQLETTDLELDQLNLEKYDIEDELERTHKALEIAVDALKELRPAEKKGCYLVPTVSTTQRIIDEALEQITALKKKDK